MANASKFLVLGKQKKVTHLIAKIAKIAVIERQQGSATNCVVES